MSMHLYNGCPYRPSHCVNSAPENALSPSMACIYPYNQLQQRNNYYRPWQMVTKDIGSTVHYDKDKFYVNLDVQQFTPAEITVKAVDGVVIVEGKHEEKEDEHGFISRHFVRKYLIPKQYIIESLQSSLSSDGVLSISAPKRDAIEGNEKEISIIHTGEPHKPILAPTKAQ